MTRRGCLQIRDLNAGTFGFVELALDKSTGQQVAIKFTERGDKVCLLECCVHLAQHTRCQLLLLFSLCKHPSFWMWPSSSASQLTRRSSLAPYTNASCFLFADHKICGAGNHEPQIIDASTHSPVQGGQ